ncbi:MAG: hypothetical protein KC636_36980 [Myxococcales bacterium]|nr:hypothetical protein [Myxococcales bacterium]
MTTSGETQNLDAWRARAGKELGGDPLESLDHALPGGLVLHPLYTAASLPADVSPLPGRGWTIAQEYTLGQEAALAEDLGRGVEAAWVALDDAAAGDRSTGAGEGLAGALAAVDPARHELYVEAGASGLPTVAAMEALLARGGRELGGLRGGVVCDPIGAMARAGGLAAPIERALDDLALVTGRLEARAPALRSILISGVPYHEAGASAVDELALLIASGITYLRGLARRGVAVDVIAARSLLSLSVGRDLLVDVAKLRAARRLWARVVATLGGAPGSVHVHASGSGRALTREDPWVNLIRATTQAFTAVVGGARLISVKPHDAALGPSSSLARRLTGNLQTILRAEGHLGQVADPAGGSYCVEALTDQLARAAWERARAVERSGGLIAGLCEGTIQAAVTAQAEADARAVATRRLQITGVNHYPLLDPVDRAGAQVLKDSSQTPARAVQTQPEGTTTARAPDAAAQAVLAARLAGLEGEGRVAALLEAAREHDLSSLLAALAGDPVAIRPLPAARLAAPFEGLRAAARARGEVLRVRVDAQAGRGRELAFAREALAAGGFMVTNEGPAIATLLLGAPPAELPAGPLVAACRTPEDRAALEQAGVPVILSPGCDLLDALTRLHARVAAEVGV